MSILIAPDFFDDPRFTVAGEDATHLYLRALIRCEARGHMEHVDADSLETISTSRDVILSALSLEQAGLWTRVVADSGAVVGWRVAVDPTRVRVAP